MHRAAKYTNELGNIVGASETFTNKYEHTTDQELTDAATYTRGRCFVFTH